MLYFKTINIQNSSLPNYLITLCTCKQVYTFEALCAYCICVCLVEIIYNGVVLSLPSLPSETSRW